MRNHVCVDVYKFSLLKATFTDSAMKRLRDVVTLTYLNVSG